MRPNHAAPHLAGIFLIALAVAAMSGCSAREAGRAPITQAAAPATNSPLSPAAEKPALVTDSPLPTPTQTTIPVDWTDLGPPPTPEPTPTVPPFPTLVPTPMVTPIPVSYPPFLPGLEALTRVPDRVFIREGDRIFLLSEDGRSRRLLVDTAVAAGLYVQHYPLRNVEGPRLEWGRVSPDGSTVALTVTDVWDYKRGESFTWQIYLLDVDSGRLTYLVDGRNPVWAPDSRRVALEGGGGVLVVDVATGDATPLPGLEDEEYVTELAWSPDGDRIACASTLDPMGGYTEIRILDAEGVGEPIVVPRLPDRPWAGGLTWLADARGMVVVRLSYDPGMAFHASDLWYLDTVTLEQTRLTENAIVRSVAASPADARWVAFIGEYPFEAPEFPPGYGVPLDSIWLVDVEAGGSRYIESPSGDLRELRPSPGIGRIRRLTTPLGDIRALSWSPDGTRLYFHWMASEELWSLDLASGSLSTVVSTEINFSMTR